MFMGFAVQLMMRGTTIEMKAALTRTRKIVVELGNLYTSGAGRALLCTNKKPQREFEASDRGSRGFCYR
jgi:hypothetical protein